MVAWSCHLLQASGRAPAPRDDPPDPQPRLPGPQAGTACWAKLYFRACNGVCWQVGWRCSVLFLPGGTRASMRSRHWKRPGLSQATPFCLLLLRGLGQMLSAIMPQGPPLNTGSAMEYRAVPSRHTVSPPPDHRTQHSSPPATCVNCVALLRVDSRVNCHPTSV